MAQISHSLSGDSSSSPCTNPHTQASETLSFRGFFSFIKEFCIISVDICLLHDKLYDVYTQKYCLGLTDIDCSQITKGVCIYGKILS